MTKTLYRDNFLELFTDGTTVYYANVFCQYLEMPAAIGSYIAKRLKQDWKRGYKLLDYWKRKPRKVWKNA